MAKENNYFFNTKVIGVILILISYTINSILFGVILYFVHLIMVLLGLMHIIPSYKIMVYAFAINLVFLVLGNSILGDKILSLKYKARALLEHEKIKLDEIINGLFTNITSPSSAFNLNLKDVLSLRKLNIKITLNYKVFAKALGYNTVLLSNASLNELDSYELRAILIYELCYIYTRFSLILQGIWFVSIPFNLLLKLNTKLKFITIRSFNFNFLNHESSLKKVVFISYWILKLVFLPVIILVILHLKICKFMKNVIQVKMQQNIDQAVAKLGYGEFLIQVLEKALLFETQDNNFIIQQRIDFLKNILRHNLTYN